MPTFLGILAILVFWAAVAVLVVRVALAAFTGPAACLNPKRFLVRTLKRLVTALVIIGLVACIRRFYPEDRLELPNPAAPGNRLFAVHAGFGDISVNIRACDWPHTFVAPFRVGGASRPDHLAESRFYWSKDGSVIAWRVRWRDSPESHYLTAYDYREHRPIGSSTHREHNAERSRRIGELMDRRGGIGDEVPDVSDGKF